MPIVQESAIFVMFNTAMNVQVLTDHLVSNVNQDLAKHPTILARESAEEPTVWNVKTQPSVLNVWMGIRLMDRDAQLVQHLIA